MSGRVRGVVAFAVMAALAIQGCSAPVPPNGPAAGATGGSSEIVVAAAQETSGYNPVAGHGELGVSLVYDGLLRLNPTDPGQLPGFAPALASAMPTPNADLTEWTVRLRRGVTFHDGTAFNAADVVATYRAVLDPASASEIASAFEMIADVTAGKAGDEETVTFHLRYPYADFPARMLLSIAPSERLTGGLASESTLNREPVGTGPYRLTALTPDRAEFTAYPEYWAGAPQVTKFTSVVVPDDNARVLRMRTGEFQGTIVPPSLAQSFASVAGQRVVTAKSADWRGVSFPANSAFAKDPAARLAVNLAVDRDAMVKTVLAGRATAAYTPVSAVYGDSFNPEATFPHDPERARQMLTESGWTPGADGIRTRGGERASFTVAYNPTDTVRRDLATAFVGDMKKIGVEVRLEGLGWDRIEPRVGELGILLGGGDKPYSIDTQVHATLHTPVPGTSIYDNPGRLGNPTRDAALDEARRAVDPKRRAELYRAVQDDYVKDPSFVILAVLDHVYVARDDDWDKGPLTVEPHAHDVDWGPWWNLGSWKR